MSLYHLIRKSLRQEEEESTMKMLLAMCDLIWCFCVGWMEGIIHEWRVLTEIMPDLINNLLSPHG